MKFQERLDRNQMTSVTYLLISYIAFKKVTEEISGFLGRLEDGDCEISGSACKPIK